jgi:hypothetical protein
MTIYTEQDLDKLEAAALAQDITPARPADRKAGRMFLLTDEDKRSYDDVAARYKKSNGESITNGRAAVYVRNYLTSIDKMDEAPQRGRRNGGGTRSITATGNGVADQVLAMREQYLSEQDRIATLVNDANEAVEAFDADEYRAEVLTDLREELEKLTARIEAFEADTDGVATKSADEYISDLRTRAEKLNTDSGSKLEFLNAELAKSNAMLKMLVSMDEDLANKLPDDLKAELAEEPVEEESAA